MKPMAAGKARTELDKNIREIADSLPMDAVHDKIFVVSAVLGGAINAALEDMGHDKGLREVFWRYANENCWRMTRSLRASGQLEKIR